MLIDTHTHLQEDVFAEDFDAVLARMRENQVRQAIVVGTDLQTGLDALHLANTHAGLFAAVGIHPHEAGKAVEADFTALKKLFDADKTVAMGEIGLDYYYDFTKRSVQKLWFERQLVFAYENKLPVILHIRDAHQDTVDLLKGLHGQIPKCVVHCCSASREMAKIYLDMGFFLSFTGMITFKNAKSPKETCAYTPMERLMIETDCPYMAPVPMRGRRNEPAYVAYVESAMAALKETDAEAFAQILKQNTETFFGLPDYEKSGQSL